MSSSAKQTVRKWGNGLGIFLPKSLAQAAGFGIGTPITQDVRVAGELIVTSEKAPDCKITDYDDLVLLAVQGVSIPLTRQTAIELADKAGSNEGFVDMEEGTELSVTPDAGCIKLRLDRETAVELKRKLQGLAR